MLTTWVLFIGGLLGGTDLYIYVEDDPHTRSQHVLDALQTPISDLRQIAPNNASRAFLDDLEWDRCALDQHVDLHILTRDDVGIASYQELPAYSFSSRENPTPLHPQCYLHWQLVPEHLIYVAQIRRHSLDKVPAWGARYLLGVPLETSLAWFYADRRVTPCVIEIDGESRSGRHEETTYRFIYAPSPPILLPMPVTILRKAEWKEETSGGEVYLKQHSNCSQDYLNQLLKEADMGTGYIHIPSLSEEEGK